MKAARSEIRTCGLPAFLDRWTVHAQKRSAESTRDELRPYVFYSYTEATARLRVTRDERDGSLIVEGNRDGLAKLAQDLASFALSHTDTDHEHWLDLEGDFTELLLDLDEHLKR